MAAIDTWPPLPWDDWTDTCDTLHMWFQIVGKLKLQLAPFLNELWQVAFDVTPRGLTTGAVPSPRGMFEVRFDFIDHSLVVANNHGPIKTLPLSSPNQSFVLARWSPHRLTQRHCEKNNDRCR